MNMNWDAISGISAILSVIIAIAPFVYATWLKLRQRPISPRFKSILRYWLTIGLSIAFGFLIGKNTNLDHSDGFPPSKNIDEIASFSPYYFDGFDNNMGGWYEHEWIDDDGDGGIVKVDRRYRIELNFKSGASFAGSFAADLLEPDDDFYADVEAQKLLGSNGSGYGLMIHYNETNEESSYYYFQISNSQVASIYVVKSGKKTLLASTRVESIVANGINKLGVLANQDNYKFYVNDVKVLDVSDPRVSGGRIGLWVANDAYEESIVEFDNFRILKP